MATQSRLRCGLTQCEALHSITLVYSGSSAFKLEVEGNHHTRRLQPPPIIDDDLTLAQKVATEELHCSLDVTAGNHSVRILQRRRWLYL